MNIFYLLLLNLSKYYKVMKIPKLYFKYAYPLDNERRQLFANKNLGEYPPFEIIKNKKGYVPSGPHISQKVLH